MVDIDMEMNIIHCNNPEENPIPEWLRKKAEHGCEGEGMKEAKKEEDMTTFSAPVFPSFCRPLKREKSEK